MPVVAARVNGARFDLLLHTGASIHALPREVVEAVARSQRIEPTPFAHVDPWDRISVIPRWSGVGSPVVLDGLGSGPLGEVTAVEASGAIRGALSPQLWVHMARRRLRIDFRERRIVEPSDMLDGARAHDVAALVASAPRRSGAMVPTMTVGLDGTDQLAVVDTGSPRTILYGGAELDLAGDVTTVSTASGPLSARERVVTLDLPGGTRPVVVREVALDPPRILVLPEGARPRSPVRLGMDVLGACVVDVFFHESAFLPRFSYRCDGSAADGEDVAEAPRVTAQRIELQHSDWDAMRRARTQLEIEDWTAVGRCVTDFERSLARPASVRFDVVLDVEERRAAVGTAHFTHTDPIPGELVDILDECVARALEGSVVRAEPGHYRVSAVVRAVPTGPDDIVDSLDVDMEHAPPLFGSLLAGEVRVPGDGGISALHVAHCSDPSTTCVDYRRHGRFAAYAGYMEMNLRAP